MIEIMQSIQSSYVPVTDQTSRNGNKKKVILQKILFGGDNLTEERARNLQGAMADGGSDYDCLNGIIPKNEDWHAIRYMYKVLFAI